VVGLKLQVAPVGSPEQLKLTVPLKLFCGVIVTVLVTLLPAETLAGLTAVADIEKELSLANHASARLFASTEPRPVTRL